MRLNHMFGALRAWSLTVAINEQSCRFESHNVKSQALLGQGSPGPGLGERGTPFHLPLGFRRGRSVYFLFLPQSLYVVICTEQGRVQMGE